MSTQSGAPAFTRETKNPYTGKDEWLIRPVIPFEYLDMRGRHWLVCWRGRNERWGAFPFPDAAKAYGLPAGKLYAAADNARLLIEGIEERLESHRARDARDRWPWWAWLVAAYALDKVTKKGSR